MKLFWILSLLVAVVLLCVALWHNDGGDQAGSIEPSYKVGDKLGELNGVVIYYNGDSSVSSGRNMTDDGYNLGLKYQCVEFVKRYYYEKLDHQMPSSWGHAKDFFDGSVMDGALNKSRGLLQFTNASKAKPELDDLIVFGPSGSNSYGHVAIVSKVTNDEIEIAQQNAGVNGKPRVKISLINVAGEWRVDNARVLGWLRMAE